MWHFASKAFVGITRSKTISPITSRTDFECADDDSSSSTSGAEGLECPICWESFNVVENVPYVLWCGHTLCKNCVMGLQWAVLKFPSLPVQLPLFISCPWCNLLSLRFIYRGNLVFPRKNFLLLWMVESMNGNRVGACPQFLREPHVNYGVGNGTIQQNIRSDIGNDLARPLHSLPQGPRSDPDTVNQMQVVDQLQSTMRRSLAVLVHLIAKFALLVLLLLIVLYAIPVSAIILALYALATVLFALPSFLTLYFAYPSLDWMVREIVT